MTKRSDNLFLALLAGSLVLLGLIINHNITALPKAAPIASACADENAPASGQKAAALEDSLLHEAKYWNKINE
jgi:hypothetical protein